MKMTALLLTFTSLFSSSLLAHNLTIGDALPSASVAKHGELTLADGEIEYQPWQTESLAGKVRVIQAIAGRSAAKELNAELMDAITEADFAQEQYQTTTIINQDDAMWGTGGFVKSSAEDSKKEFYWSSMVLDADGAISNAWALSEKSSAIIVLDKNSTVLFAHEGKLSEAQVSQVLAMINDNID